MNNILTEEFVKYEDVKNISPEEFFKGSQFAINAFKNKYLIKEFEEKNPAEVFQRVAKYISSVEKKEDREYWCKRWFHEMWTGQWMPAGSILQGAGNTRSVSMMNCTTIGFEKDSLEAIFEAEYKVAKVAAYRQGLGVHFNLRPKGMKINNASNFSSGNTHWMKKINATGNFVGQLGRIPAMLFSINDHNPDLIDFITVKSDQKTIDNANISVHWSDAFMECLLEDGIWKMKYESESGEVLEKEEKASVIFDLFVNNNWAWAEPGAQFIDTAKKYSNSDYLRDERWKIKSTNACCIVGESLISTNYGLLSIEKIHNMIQKENKKDLTALSFNIQKKQFETKKILNSFQHRNDTTVKLEFKENEFVNSIECSLDHPILIENKGYVKAEDLILGDECITLTLKNSGCKLTSIIINTEIKPLFDLEIEDNHNFVANNIVVHNSEQFLEFVNKKSAGLCALSSVNYMYLYRKFGKDINKAIHYLQNNIAPSILRFIDNVVEMEIRDKRYPITEQLHSLKALRRVGVGVTNLDGYLIYNGIGYDTEEGIDTIYKLTDAFNLGLYKTSIAIGEEKGSFEAFNKEFYCESPFIQQMMKRHKLKFDTMRNVCVGSIAPTGTLSLMFPELVSYGIEPLMALYYWKRQRTSGKWAWSFCVPAFVRELLQGKGIDVGMESDSIDDDDLGSKGEKISKIIDEHFPKDKFKPAHLIDPFKKVKLMALLTKECVDSSISVTYNLPEDVSKETVKNLYIEAWKQGVKSIAIYRDKSREGVVEFESPRIASKRYETPEKKFVEDSPSQLILTKRPEILEADVYHLTVKNEKWVAFVGLEPGNGVYEIFAGKQEEIHLPKKYSKGKIIKNKKKYYFVSGEGEEEIKLNITDSFKNDEHSALTRQISLNLRHKTPLVYVIDQLDKSNGTIVDFSKILMRVLKNYLSEEQVSGKLKCKSCGSKNIVFQEKCFMCLDCGDSKCS